MGVSENVVYPIVPNGFADHYPVFKWLFHWEYTLFSDKPIFKKQFIQFLFFSEGQEVSNDITGRHSIDPGPSTDPGRNDRLRMRPPWPPEHGPRVQGRPVPRFGPDGQELQDLELQPGAISPGLVADESMWDYCGIGWGVYLQHDYNRT